MEEEEAQTFDIVVHFPNYSVTLTNKTAVQAKGVRECMVSKTRVLIDEGNAEYVINPELVTHIKVTQHNKWF